MSRFFDQAQARADEDSRAISCWASCQTIRDMDAAQRENDGCEWEPVRNRPAFGMDAHTQEHRAEVLVGAGRNNYRLCRRCADLPQFRRMSRKGIFR